MSRLQVMFEECCSSRKTGRPRPSGQARRASGVALLVTALMATITGFLPAAEPLRAQELPGSSAQRDPAVQAGRATEPVPPPVPLRILSPVHLLFYQLPPVSAAALPVGASSFEVQLSESNALHPERDPDLTFSSQVDFEMSRLGLAYRRGVAPGWELGVEVPLYYLHGGFLDEPITEGENLFNAVKPRRRDEVAEGRQDQFSYRLLVGDEALVSADENDFGLGDVAVSVKQFLRSQEGRRPALALRAGLELPTGDRDRGFGSGGVDAAVGVAASWELGRWAAHGGAQLTVPMGEVGDRAGLDTLRHLSIYADGAYSRWERLTLHAQLAAVSPVFETDHQRVSRTRAPGGDDSFEGHVVQITPAVSWKLGDGGSGRSKRVFVGLVEDFGSSENTAFDVTVFATVRWTFGG